jgi:Ca-activated chloride channel family protein
MREIPVVSVRARLDRDTARIPQNTEAAEGLPFLLVEIGADGCRPGRSSLRRPLDLAVVVDSSTSMGDRLLVPSRRIVRTLVERLAPCDRLTLVSFGGGVRFHLDRMPMDPVGRTLAVKTTRELQARERGSNLAKGWFEGALRILRGARRNDGFARRVVVLSDGHADRGIMEPGELAAMASELRASGTFTSAVGLGTGRNTVYLASLCEAGGGRLHTAGGNGLLDGPSLAELLDNRDPAAEDVELELLVPDGVRAEDTRGDGGEGAEATPIGPLVPGASRAMLFLLHVRPSGAGRKFRFRASVRYRIPGKAATVSATSNWVFLTVKETGGAPCRIPDTVLAHRIALLWREGLVRRAIALDSEGHRGGDPSSLHRSVGAFRAYCRHVTGTGVLLNDLDRALEACRLCGEPPPGGRGEDYRLVRRAAWSAYLSRMNRGDGVRI